MLCSKNLILFDGIISKEGFPQEVWVSLGKPRMVLIDIVIDKEVWLMLHALKLYLKKRSLNDTIRQIVDEWMAARGISLELLERKGSPYMQKDI